jgi:formylglycine-generating enzyme required for sulfatase activity
LIGAAVHKKYEEKPRPETKKENATPEPGTVFRDTLKGGTKGPETVVIPAGEFRMEDIQGGGFDSKKPVHRVIVSKPFAMG